MNSFWYSVFVIVDHKGLTHIVYSQSRRCQGFFVRNNYSFTFPPTAQNGVDTKLLLEMTKTYSGAETKKKGRKSKIELKSEVDYSSSLNCTYHFIFIKFLYTFVLVFCYNCP